MTRVKDPIPPPDARSLDQIKQDIRGSWQAHGADCLHDLRRLRAIPAVLWHCSVETATRSQEAPLSAQIPAIWPAFFERAKVRENLLLQAIDGWLRDFRPDTFGLADAGRDIVRRLGITRYPRLLPWAAAQNRFGLFFADTGPGRVAESFYDSSIDVGATLQAACLDSPLRQQGNFFRACLLEMLKLTPLEFRKQNASDALSRLRNLIEVEDAVRDRFGRPLAQHRMRFPAMERELANGCLLAWAEGKAHASAPKQAVQRLLLTLIGDPRLRSQRWQNVDGQLTAIMRRWVSEQSLETFLTLIRENNDSTQWRHREAFWRACFKRVPDAEVWVVLGRDLAQRAKLVADLQGNFGQMGSSPQAVLLMRMRNLVFSEWSNVGALRAWDVVDPKCPKMYAMDGYTQSELKAACLAFPDEFGTFSRYGRNDGNGLTHFGPKRGLWQARAAHLLRHKAGIQLLRSDYMPQ